jgi:hypothetical protein
MTSSGGRKTVSYLVKCALASNDSLVKQDQNGTNYTFAGGLGLCPAWKNGGVNTDGTCQELVSACMMAHVNTAGVHIPLWLDAANAKIGWGLSSSFPFQEGSFFGNIITTGDLSKLGQPGVNGPAAYFCDGDGFTTGINGEVAGRLGAGSSNAPYVNPFGDSVLCKNSPSASQQWSAGMYDSSGHLKDPDGYSTLHTGGNVWNNAITVWRSGSYTPVFDPSYRYVIFSLITRATPMVVDGATNPVVQQPMSKNYATSELILTASGSNWTISMNSAPNMCLDAGAACSGAAVTFASCNGSTSQQWTITPQGNTYGAFQIQNVKTGNALNVTNPGNSTLQKNAGVPFDVEPYAKWSSQQFRIQAVATVN